MRQHHHGCIYTSHRISIHAPLAGCDSVWIKVLYLMQYFNPRTPCGVRRKKRLDNSIVNQFQSTHPLRGATTWIGVGLAESLISIHAPLAGCDSRSRCRPKQAGNFNPRTPCGVRHSQYFSHTVRTKFQSTHPLRGATLKCKLLCCLFKFQSTHPLRGATLNHSVSPPFVGNFNPRTPCGVRLPSRACSSF